MGAWTSVGPRAGAGAAAADVLVIQTVHYGHHRPYSAGRVRASEQVNTAVGVKHYLLFVTNCSLLGGLSSASPGQVATPALHLDNVR